MCWSRTRLIPGGEKAPASKPSSPREKPACHRKTLPGCFLTCFADPRTHGDVHSHVLSKTQGSPQQRRPTDAYTPRRGSLSAPDPTGRAHRRRCPSSPTRLPYLCGATHPVHLSPKCKFKKKKRTLPPTGPDPEKLQSVIFKGYLLKITK